MNKNKVLVLFGIILINLAVYFYNISDFFVSDDFDWLNLTINGAPIWKSFVGNYYGLHGVGGTFRPLVNLIFEIQTTIFGLNPVGYHIILMLFNSFNAFLIYLIVDFFAKTKKNINGLAILSAVIFIILPNHFEVVVWSSAIGDLMATFFYLLSFYIFVYLKNSWKKTFLILFSFLLSLLSKEIGITLPFLFLGYEIIIKRNFNIKSLLRLLYPYYLLLMIYLLYRYWAIGLGFGYYAVDSLKLDIKGYVRMLIDLDVNTLFYNNLRIKIANFIFQYWYAYLALWFIALLWLSKEFVQAKSKYLIFLVYYWLLNIALVLPLGMSKFNDEGERYGYIASVACAVLLAWCVSRLVEYKRYIGITFVILLFSYFISYDIVKSNNWHRASLISQEIVTNLNDIDFAGYKKTYFIGLPDNYNGAQIMRNGIVQAVRLQFPDSRYNVERVPVYQVINKINYEYQLYGVKELKQNGIYFVTKNSAYTVTGNATQTFPEYVFELWNYDYNLNISDTIRLMFKGGREFDWARNEIQIVYYEKGLKSIQNDK